MLQKVISIYMSMEKFEVSNKAQAKNYFSVKILCN